MQRLQSLLAQWPEERALIFCDELCVEEDATRIDLPDAPAAILIGPEGGFSEAERRRLRHMTGTRILSLGPRILRADTAAVAALTIWQTRLGDWA